MRKVRWGRLAEIAHLRKVPTIPLNQRTSRYAYDSLPPRLKHLASWRRMHKIRQHLAIRKVARRQGIKPSSDMPLASKIGFLRKRNDGR